MNDGRLANKTAVIVGAGQTEGATIGNGRATSLVFAREGARLLLVDRDEASVRETARLVTEQQGGSAEVVVLDITTEDACRTLVTSAQETLGRIDVLHNNVGIGAGDATPHRLEEEAWDRILDVNAKAMWLTCKHVVPIMREQGGGAIVNVSSVASLAAAGNLTAYKVSKAAVNALTHSLAITNARHGIRVNAVLPGLMDTPMAVDAMARSIGQAREAVAEVRAQMVPMGHQGTAWDVAHAALYLASDEAAFVTGVLLPVDGGQLARIG